MIMVRLNHSVRARLDRLSEAISVGKCELSEQEQEVVKKKQPEEYRAALEVWQ